MSILNFKKKQDIIKKYFFFSLSCAIVIMLFVNASDNQKNNTDKKATQSQIFDDTVVGKIKTIDATDKSIAFSRYAQPGKITLFIMGAHWCTPCYDLKAMLETAFTQRIISPKEVDIYYCNLSKSKKDNFKDMDTRKGYRNFKYVDKLTAAFPITYILTPTTNCYTYVEGAKYEEILGYIKELIVAKREYFDLDALNDNCSGQSTSDDELENENHALKIKNKELEKEIAILRGGIENSAEAVQPNATPTETKGQIADTEMADLKEIVTANQTDNTIRLVFKFNNHRLNTSTKRSLELDTKKVISEDRKSVSISNEHISWNKNTLPFNNRSELSKMKVQITDESNFVVKLENHIIEHVSTPKWTNEKVLYWDITYK